MQTLICFSSTRTDGFPSGEPYQGCVLVENTSVIIIVAYLLLLFSETSSYSHTNPAARLVDSSDF